MFVVGILGRYLIRENRDMNELFAEVQLPELSLKEKRRPYGRLWGFFYFRE